MPAWIEHIECISPLGSDWRDTWEGLLGAKTVARPYESLPALATSGNHSAAVPGATSRLELCHDHPGGRAARLAIACIAPLMTVTNGPVDFYGGSTHGEADLIIEHARRRQNGYGEQTIPDSALRKGLEGESIPTILAQEFPRLRIASWIYSSCVSSLHALMLAIDSLDTDPDATHMVAGVDALNDMELAGFYRSGGLTRSSCRPYHHARDGILAAEGAAALTLTGRKRGDGIRIIGFGLGCDAGHPTSPDKNGRGLQRAIDQALHSAGLDTTQIGAVILHGTGTPLNDEAEGSCIARVMGSSVPVTTIKGTLGHAMGAAGLFNVLTACNVLRTGFLPPARLDPDELPPSVDVVTGEPRAIDNSKPILVLASGFGGNNTAVILQR